MHLIVGIMPLPHAEGLGLPGYAHEGDSGFDFRAAIGEPITIPPGARAAIPTGLRFSIPDGYELQVRPRSGLARKSSVETVFGTVDSSYHGEVSITLCNNGTEPFTVNRGDRVAQGVVAPVIRARWTSFIESPSTRGANGFGSTGA